MTDTVPLSGQLSSRQIQVLTGFHEKKPVALARAISMVEDEPPGFQELLHELLKAGPETARLGFTGPPGAGKSSLVAATATRYRSRDETVGVVAVDPTSPYSGGALLGDRIRMNELATDPGIFIRSMASRGSLGGLATTTKEVLDLMDMYRFDRLLVETVGVGQTELEITAAADTVIVVLVPESGDAIQAMKAGLMEIADIFVVNKADRPGADRLVKEIRQAMHLRAGSALKDVPAHHGVDLSRVMKKERAETPSVEDGDWSVPVLATTAQSGEGVDELLEAVERHRSWLVSSGQLEERRRARAKGRVQDVVNRELLRITWRKPETVELLEVGVERMRTSDATPYSVAKDIIEGLLR
jgi:LAO/AO transport system kinase